MVGWWVHVDISTSTVKLETAYFQPSLIFWTSDWSSPDQDTFSKRENPDPEISCGKMLTEREKVCAAFYCQDKAANSTFSTPIKKVDKPIFNSRPNHNT